MCGVFGFVGRESDVGDMVLSALKTLEYRGYDSWGMAVSLPDNLFVAKNTGRINGQRVALPKATMGLGHTRWATHGGVTVENAHPHLDCAGRIAVVHNGIIENHEDLRRDLMSRGHQFASETDSEVVAHLVEERLAAGNDLTSAVSEVHALLAGYNAIVVLDRLTHSMVATKLVSPLVIGVGKSGSTVASDPLALLGHASGLVFLEDDQIALLTRDGLSIFARNSLSPIAPTLVMPSGTGRDAELGQYPDFFTKEVHEQPASLRRLVVESRPEIEALAAAVQDSAHTVLVGCGTAWNAALAGTYLFDELCGKEVAAIPASEFRYRPGAIGPETLVVAMSQSGETVDVIEATNIARANGARVAAIVNSPNSTLDRSVDTRVLLRTGVEQCVLATKSYTAKLATLLLTACAIGGRWDDGLAAVDHAAGAIFDFLNGEGPSRVRAMAARAATSDHLFVIGRGVHYPSALEAALKIKEVSYIHAEGFASGELKHGVIALIGNGTPCLVFAPNDLTRIDTLSGAAELRSRGGHIVGIGPEASEVFDDFIAIPDVGLANPLVEAVPGQLFGYFAAIARGTDPDRPRNLAKSVTVK
ncbi:MAG: glutamine--fructose-6-phosphate transaminase (isomerizing) [Thermomicrobiales bacterium]